jgi:aminomethyltransferase
VEYSGLIAEHLSVRSAAGLFDVSHMCGIGVEGTGAEAFLQRVTCNDVSRLSDGQAQYSALPNDLGAPLDDIILYRRAPDRYFMVANAANVEKDLAWLRSQGPEGCVVASQRDDFALLALQGPRAEAILQRVTALDLPAIRFYHFAEGEVTGVRCTVARTGYTGEDGFEIVVPPAHVGEVWGALLEAGRDDGLVPAGLGARDTLRLEARMCLYGQDMDEETSLVEAGLGWIVATGEGKGPFPGRQILEDQKKAGPRRRLVGFEVVGRGIARHGYGAYVRHEPAGVVTSGTYAPFLQKSIGLAYLPAADSANGTPFEVDIRGNRVAARVVPTPFYKRQRA